MEATTIITAIIGSNALFAFLTYLIQRHDSKKSGIERIADKIDSLEGKMDENSAILARTHILRFSDELQNGVAHSQEYFHQQMDDIDTYDEFCEKHPTFRNSYTTLAQAHIKETYKTLLAKGEFKHE